MNETGGPTSLSDLPRDELLRYGRELALPLKDDAPTGELLRLIRARQELLLGLERGALLDLVSWARRPVRASAGKEELVRAVADIHPENLSELSRRGLEALALLRGINPQHGETDIHLADRIRKAGGAWERMRRRRRKLVGNLLGRMLKPRPRPGTGAYHFLPEPAENSPKPGLVGGIARKIKGATDEYIDAKLNEVERRIDLKLDEIDARLAEWRDLEVRNRLRIIRITLLATVVVALVSLGYSYLKARADRGGPARPAVSQVDLQGPPEADAAQPLPKE